MPGLFVLRRFAVLAACFTTLLVPELSAGSHFKVLHRFLGGPDGTVANSLILDSTGNLYGTTQEGGNSNCDYYYPGCGVVFEMTRSSKGKWQELVLYAFHGQADGGMPVGNLLFDESGNLYGTTAAGGIGNCQLGCGTVFELSPSQNGWAETVLYNFQNGSDGSHPSGLTFDASGNLFGVSQIDSYGSAIFELSPPQQKGGTWTETTLYNQDYFQLSPNLVFDKKGRLYDTSPYSNGFGVVFDLQQATEGWQETNLFDFEGGGNGYDPQAGVILDGRGRMYGTATAGGNKWGIAFELKRSGNHWKQVMLYNFCSLNSCADGASPDAPLTFDQHGNLYGMTSAGGKGCEIGCGVVFRLSPARAGNWKETVLHTFQGGSDGQGSANRLTLDDKGHIYGTTADNGDSFSTLFELTP